MILYTQSNLIYFITSYENFLPKWQFPKKQEVCSNVYPHIVFIQAIEEGQEKYKKKLNTGEEGVIRTYKLKSHSLFGNINGGLGN